MLEATLIPTALFYIAWLSFGRWAGYGTALVWAYGVLLRRLRKRERVPGILVLSVVGLTARTCIAVATGSTFVYFAQPVMGTSLVALLFFGSTLTNRPFIGRVAGDFYPLTTELAGRHRVRRLFRNLTLLWAGVQLLNAGATAALLLTLSTAAFIPTKTAVALAITASGVTATVVLSLRVARYEGIVGSRMPVPATA